MANTTRAKRRRGAWTSVLSGIALVMVLMPVEGGAAQQTDQQSQPPRVRSPRLRELLKSGLDHYKSGDYEGAAKFFNQAQLGQSDLSPTERNDLKNFMQKNHDALAAQQEGRVQLRQAEEALRRGNTPAARGLIKGLTANQYLSAADRQALATLNANLRGGAAPAVAQKGTEIVVPNNEAALLAAGREALKRGDFDAAEALNNQANHLAPFMHSPWATDTPSKLRRDIMAARARTEKRDSGGIVKTVTNLFKGKDDKKDGPTIIEGSTPITNEGPPLGPTIVKNGSKYGPASDGPNVRQTIYPGSDGTAPSSSANKLAARRLIKEAYKALEANDLDRARRLANQAKELSPDLEWWEENPNRLLEDIQRRAAANGMSGANAGRPLVPGEAHNLVKEARNLLQQDKIDDAEALSMRAAASQPKGWGLFEDSPDKLRADIQKARGKRDRDEATKLLVEARKAFGAGRLQDAKAMANRSAKLHGPYSIWDMGDRPQKLLDEIHRAELKNPALAAADLARTTDALKDAHSGDFSGFTSAGKSAYSGVPPLVSGTSQAAAKVRAVGLLREARELQKRGLLVEARAKTIEADNLHVTFGPDEDTPASVLVSLAAQCERMVDQYLQRATDFVQNHPTDTTRFQKAMADVNSARRIAQAFRLDNMRIEQKTQWLQQAAVSSGLQPIAAAGMANDPSAVFNAGGLNTAPPLPDSPAGRNRMLGLEKLDKARLELRAGNLAMARRLAEEAFNPQYGTQEEAAMVLRSIDADDYNHRASLANRDADAGIDAYRRGEFRQAAGIFNGVDIRLVQADKARRIGELMNTPQMQPQTLQLVNAKGTNQGPNIGASAGNATATDLQPSDDLTKSFRAMEEVQFQQMRERGITAQKTAMELFKAGRKAQAVDTLREYLDELAPANFDAQRLALLKRPVENRMQQYRTVLAQEAIEKQVDGASSHWDENRFQKNIRKTQDEVAEQIKQYRALVKEGKYKEALAAARKAKELDPDNLAADAAIQIVTIKINERDYAKGRDNNEDMFVKSLNPDNGPYVDNTNPLRFDPEALKRAQARETGKNGFTASPPRDPVERSIERRLSEPISLTFKDTPLQQVIADLQDMAGINIMPDRAALQEANISLDMPLTLVPVKNISLKSALNILLDQIKLTYVIKDQALQITTKEKARGNTILKTYSIADLVIPIENHPTPGMNDINTALARHLAAASGISSATSSPYTTPTSLANGSPVSSQSSGVGSTFAMNSIGGSPNTMAPTRAPGETIQDLLIDLIQNTVAQNTWQSVGGQGKIQYYPLGMALVVNQTQEVQEDVAALLAALRRLQDLEVAIEMRLVSVSESFFERIGVDFNVNIKSPTSAANQVDLVNGQFTPFGQVNSQFQGIKAITGLTPAGTLTPDLGIPIRNSSFDFSVPPFGGFPGTAGADGGISLGLAFLSDIQVFMFLEAAQGDRRLNVMQAPKLTVFNGSTANISINDQQFFLTGVNINQANGQIFFSPNNQPFPLGVTMQVTPVVSADRRFVRLNLNPSLTNLASTNVPLIPVQIPVPQLLEGPGNAASAIGQPVVFQMFFQQPNFTTISLNTTVNVPDGGTVLLGGLKTMSEGRNEFGPPLLSKIPYLNRLFTNVAYGRDGQSLMIMVTPRIIINEEEEQIFTNLVPQIPRP